MTLRSSLRSAEMILLAVMTTLPSALIANDSRAVLKTLMAQDEAVARVGYRLATANRSLCVRKLPLSGLTIHAAVQYAPLYRASLAALTGLDHGFAIAAVVPGSPADHAGLHGNDRLLSIAGIALPEVRSDRADESPVERVTEQLDSAMLQGSVSLRIARGSVEQSIAFSPEIGCATRFQVVSGTKLAASTDGRLISVRSAMVSKASNDAELSVVLGHELAHGLFDHRMDATGKMIKSGRMPPGGREKRADIVGFYLSARAGYDPNAGWKFWEHFEKDHLVGVFPLSAYPNVHQRLISAQQAAMDIIYRKKIDLELWPNGYDRPA